jgi:hypothetical protein
MCLNRRQAYLVVFAADELSTGRGTDKERVKVSVTTLFAILQRARSVIWKISEGFLPPSLEQKQKKAAVRCLAKIEPNGQFA